MHIKDRILKADEGKEIETILFVLLEHLNVECIVSEDRELHTRLFHRANTSITANRQDTEAELLETAMYITQITHLHSYSAKLN